jgi:hypothetical protein
MNRNLGGEKETAWITRGRGNHAVVEAAEAPENVSLLAARRISSSLVDTFRSSCRQFRIADKMRGTEKERPRLAARVGTGNSSECRSLYSRGDAERTPRHAARSEAQSRHTEL